MTSRALLRDCCASWQRKRHAAGGGQFRRCFVATIQNDSIDAMHSSIHSTTACLVASRPPCTGSPAEQPAAVRHGPHRLIDRLRRPSPHLRTTMRTDQRKKRKTAEEKQRIHMQHSLTAKANILNRVEPDRRATQPTPAVPSTAVELRDRARRNTLRLAWMVVSVPSTLDKCRVAHHERLLLRLRKAPSFQRFRPEPVLAK